VRISFDPQIFSLQAYGGVARYFHETAMRVAALVDTRVSVLAFAHINPYLQAAPHDVVIGRRIPALPGPLLPFLAIANQLLARAWLARNPADLVHETYYSRAPTAPAGTPMVLTVFDMIHEKFPAYAPRTKRIVAWKRAAIGRADHLICISENTQRDLLDVYDIPRSRTSVVKLGFSLQSGAGAAAPAAEPYLLYVGKRGGYKDFTTLLEALALRPALTRDFLLVCFGDAPFSGGELALMRKLGLPSERVRHVAGDDAQLAACYRHATLFVYPSRYEGFGLPPLEAMASGTPVVTSNVSSLPEVAGDAAVLVDPYDPQAIADGIYRVLTDEQLRRDMVHKGIARAGQFSWEQSARRVRQIYGEVAER
jgi:glycosyltransferase involved in cell wall biosynthesis